MPIWMSSSATSINSVVTRGPASPLLVVEREVHNSDSRPHR